MSVDTTQEMNPGEQDDTALFYARFSHLGDVISRLVFLCRHCVLIFDVAQEQRYSDDPDWTRLTWHPEIERMENLKAQYLRNHPQVYRRSLDAEVWNRVFRFLEDDWKTLCSCALVCRSWSYIVRDILLACSRVTYPILDPTSQVDTFPPSEPSTS